jgi:trehalose 6-phosphate synthase
MTEEDRLQAERGRLEVGGNGSKYSVRYLAIDPEIYDAYYNGISNRVLWFVHHYLWDLAELPRFGSDFKAQWQAYRQVNETFAAALHEEGSREVERPAYLIQDYHLALAPALLRARQPDADIVHFTHIPFAGPVYLGVLPTSVRQEMLGGLLGADLIGFHAVRWADHFLLACRELKGARVDLRRRLIRHEGRVSRVGIYPISIDLEALRQTAQSPEAEQGRRRIEKFSGDTKLIVRVDRSDPSKNIVNGFRAYGEVLERRPEWRGRVKFLALLTRSREEVPEYRQYLEDCALEVERINQRFGASDWQPVEMVVNDDFPLSVAGYQLYDVLLVNSAFDGMNLVAKEGPAVNQRDGVLVLSENAGAYAELGRHALGVNPFDISETADALATALEMNEPERARRAKGLRAAVARNRLDQWVPKQLADLARLKGR